MKKVLFSALMISAMFVIASCGSKTNSDEAANDEAAKVEFSDPAIVFGGGIDLTSYFSAESVSQPTIYKDDYDYRYSINVKLKLIKALDILEVENENHGAGIDFTVKFLDNGGSKIATGIVSKRERYDKLTEQKEGVVLSLDALSFEKETLANKILIPAVKKIEVEIKTDGYKLKSEDPKSEDPKSEEE